MYHITTCIICPSKVAPRGQFVTHFNTQINRKTTLPQLSVPGPENWGTVGKILDHGATIVCPYTQGP